MGLDRCMDAESVSCKPNTQPSAIGNVIGGRICRRHTLCKEFIRPDIKVCGSAPKAHPHSAEAASKMARAFPSSREMKNITGSVYLQAPPSWTPSTRMSSPNRLPREPAGNPLRSTVG